MTNQAENLDTKEIASAEVTPETPAQKPIDTARIAALENEIEEFKKSLKDKVYPVKVKTAEVLGDMMSFIENEAEWEGRDAIGIYELNQQLNEVAAKKLNDGNIFLKSLAVQALSYFINKMKGKGLTTANRFMSFLKPVNGAMGLIKADTDHINNLEMQLAAVENGIEMAPPVEKEEEPKKIDNE